MAIVPLGCYPATMDSGEVAEAAGMTVTGAHLARETEQVAITGPDPAPDCANCGARLAGPFCSTCGQHGHVHRTAGALLHDIAHGVFHFEGKLWRTLPMLAWRPGELTRDYRATSLAEYEEEQVRYGESSTG